MQLQEPIINLKGGVLKTKTPNTPKRPKNPFEWLWASLIRVRKLSESGSI